MGRRRWISLVLFTSVFFLVLIAGAGLITRSEWVSGRLAGGAAASLSRLLGTDVRIQSVRLELFPPTLRVEEIRVGPAGAPIALLPVVTFRIDPVPLFFYKLDILKIKADRPHIHLARTNDGWDLPRIGPSGSGGNWSVAVGEIQLADGRLDLDLPQGSLLLEEIVSSIYPNLQEREAKFAFSAGPGTWNGNGSVQKFDRVSLKGTVGDDRFQILEFALDRGRSRLDAAGTVRDLGGGAPFLDLRARGDLRTDDISLIEGVEGTVLLDAKIAGRPSDLRIKGAGRLAALSYRDVDLGEGRISADFERGKGFVVAFSGTLFDGPIQAAASGGDPLEKDFLYQGVVRFHARRLDPLQRFVPDRFFKDPGAVKGLGIESGGEIRISGTGSRLLDMAGNGTAWVETKRPVGRLAATGTFAAKGLALGWKLSTASLAGWGAFLGLASLDGDLISEGKAAGPVNGPGITGTLSVRGLSFRGTGLGNFDGNFALSNRRIILQKADLENNASRYRAKGTVDFPAAGEPRADLTLVIDHGDPGRLAAAVYQPIPVDLPTNGTLRLQGGLNTFSIGGELRFEAGQLWGQRIERGATRFQADGNGVRIDHLLLQSGRSTLSGSGKVERSGKVSVRAEAALNDPQEISALRDRSIQGRGGATLAVEGNLARPELTARIQLEKVAYGARRIGSGEVTLRTEGSLFRVAASFEKEHLSLSAQVTRDPPRLWSLTVHASDLDLSPAISGIPGADSENLALTASIQGTLRGEGTEWRRVSGEVAATKLVADLHGARIENRGPLSIRVEMGKLSIVSFSLAGEGGSLSVSGEAELLERVDLAGQGELSLSILSRLTSRVRGATGKILVSLHAAGPWGAPKLRGEATLKQGLFELAGLGPALWIERATVLLDEKRVLLESAEGRLGTGAIHLTGEAQLGDKGFRAGLGSFRFFAEGERLPLEPDPKFSITFSPRLIFTGAGAAVREIRGEVKVDRAIYRESLSVKTLLARVGKREAEGVPSSTPFLGGAKLEIAVYGREEIQIDTNLAKMPLMLDLMIRGTYDRPVVLGRIEALDGDLMVQQRKLKVISGAVDFVSVRQTDPRVSLMAHTSVRQYEIDLAISGAPNRIDLHLTSEPSLPETDILSLLTLGRTTAELSGSQGIQRTQAAALALDALFGEQFEQAIGVDRFQVGPYEGRTGTANQTRVTVEKRAFNERLSVIFSSSLNTAEDQVVRMEYRVDPNISLIVERDELGQVGGDVKLTYRFQ